MKSNLLIIVLIAKILADNLWGLSPESIADNVYYVSQSAWFLLTTISIAFITDAYVKICAWYMVIYAIVDFTNEVLILLDMVSIKHLDTLRFIVSITISIVMVYEILRHNKK